LKSQILPCTYDDLHIIKNLHEEAINFQNQNSIQSWLPTDEHVLSMDLNSGLYYKVISEDQIQGVFKLLHSDEIIWGKREDHQAIYLHGIIAVIKKQKSLFPTILEWSKDYAKKQSKHFIRMDTWTNNPKLIQYYQSFGFEIIAVSKAASPELVHACYSSTDLTFLQYHVRE